MAEHDQVPPAMRAQVMARDNGCCRVCGRFVDTPGLHHILFKSQGGLNEASNLVTIGWTPGHDCHLRFAHGSRALVFRPVLQLLVDHPGLTALQVLRWSAMQDRKDRLPRFGAANPAAKHGHLVTEIRRRVEGGESQRSVADSLHLSSGVISRIVRGVNYPFEARPEPALTMKPIS